MSTILIDAQARLANALVEGLPTASIHAEIIELEQAAELATEREAAAVSAQTALRRAGIEARGAEIANETSGRINNAIAALSPPSLPLSVGSTSMHTSAVQSIFHSVGKMFADAEVQLEAAAAERATASIHAAKVQSRIDRLMFERQGIIGRRQRGEHHDDDGARLELISADTEGLMPIRDRAMAAEQAAKLKHQEAATAHASALDLLARHEDEAVETALVQHAESLGRFLFETLGKLETTGRRLDRRQPAWGPSAELYYSLRKIQAARGKL